MKRIGTFTLTVGFLACSLPFASAGFANGQSQGPELFPGTPAAHHLLRMQQEQQPQVKTFTGKISKNGQKFILEDESMKVSYQLDDQRKAKPYQGKKVVVTGTLDAENNMIHVQAIEEAV